MSDDVTRRLDEAGRRPVPPPDPALAEALEARLWAVAASASAEPSPPHRPRRPPAVARAVAAADIAAGTFGP